MTGKEISFAGRAAESLFLGLHRNFERKLKLGGEVWACGFELLDLFGEKRKNLRQEKGEMVARACRSLSLEIEGLVIKTGVFSDSERPKIFFGEAGKKGVVVVPPEGLPYIISQGVEEINGRGELTEIKHDIDGEELAVILNFLKEVSFRKKE